MKSFEAIRHDRSSEAAGGRRPIADNGDRDSLGGDKMQGKKVTQQNTESEKIELDIGRYYSIVYDAARMNAILSEAQATQVKIICSLISCCCMLPLRILMRVTRRDLGERIEQADTITSANR